MQDTDPTPIHSQAARLAAWIRLEQTPGVGAVSVQRLLEHFESPQAVFTADYYSLSQLVSTKVAQALTGPLPDSIASTIATTMAWLQDPNNHVLTPDDPAFPPLFRQLDPAPVLLYAKGRVDLLARPAIAIVGSRNATIQGVNNARAFGAALSHAGLAVVSGLALGIDAAAHEGGLSGPGSSVAVIGTGADRIYPRRNVALAHRLASEGCILSEYSLGMGPLPNNFPRRNRLISGLASAVLVVEAAAQSGSLITARMALDQGRDVFAIPGSIHAPLAKGCHALIKAGAKLVETADDILHELRLTPSLPAASPNALTMAEHGDELTLLYALGYGPVDGDTLAALTDLDPGFLSSQLLTLELAGHVERLPGGLFQRVKV